MTVEYKIDENDYLTFQLFMISKIKGVQKVRNRSKFFLGIYFLILGIFLISIGAFKTAFFIIIFGFSWLLLGPIWVKKYFVKHHLKSLRYIYGERLNNNFVIEIYDDYIVSKAIGTETKTRTSELDEIFEISSAIYLRFKGEQSIIFPKNKIENIQDLKKRLLELANFLNIKYVVDEIWK